MRRIAGTLFALLCFGGLTGTASGADGREVVMRAGPYTLGAFETLKPKDIVKTPTVDGYITQMFARLVDASGQPVEIQKVMLHHVVFINRGRFAGDRKAKCGARFGEPFYGTGEENQSLDLPEGYGYRTRPKDKWKMQTMLMSHSNQAQKVYVEYRMRITRERQEPVTPYWVRVTNCRNDPSWSVPGGGPPGAVSLRSKLWRVPENGRIVAGGAHLHGGAHDMTIRQPACRGRRLMGSDPTYGPPEHISYNVKPVLHEPGPVNTAWFMSGEGVNIRKGEQLRITAAYDAEKPHGGVMGVWHIYVAAQKSRPKRACADLPADRVERKLTGNVRDSPPAVRIPLTSLRDGVPTTLEHPEGRLGFFESPLDRPIVDVLYGKFQQVNLSVAAGTTVTWKFTDPVPHKVQAANGPRAMGSPTLAGGSRYERQFNVAGVYQLFCYLHPMTMHQEVTVRPGDDPLAEFPDEGVDAVGIDENDDYY